MQVSGSNHVYGFLDLCSLQKFMEILGPVVTWLLNATQVRSGHFFKKCKARGICLDLIGCVEGGNKLPVVPHEAAEKVSRIGNL